MVRYALNSLPMLYIDHYLLDSNPMFSHIDHYVIMMFLMLLAYFLFFFFFSFFNLDSFPEMSFPNFA